MDRNRGIGIVLLIVGGLLLFGQVFGDRVGGEGWPLFIILPGVALLIWAFAGGRDAAKAAVGGAVVTTIGLILFVQEAADAYETWSYAWALIVAASGAGTWLQGKLTDDAELARRGLRTGALGGALFVAFGVFFEGFVFGDLGRSVVVRYLLPALLIGAGIYLLNRQGGLPWDRDEGTRVPPVVTEPDGTGDEGADASRREAS